MDCNDVDRLAELSADGETNSTDQAELDAHLSRCMTCQRRYHGAVWFHSNVKMRLQQSSDELVAPTGLRAQIETQLSLEDRHSNPSMRLSRAVPAALCVSAIALLSWSFTGSPTVDPEEAVTHHARNLPPEVRARDAKRVQKLFRQNLRYPVRVPQVAQRPSNPHVQLVGARLSHLENRDAAYIMYDDRGARISVFASPIEGRFKMPEDFTERRVGGRRMMVGKRRGYNVVAWASGDVLYWLVSSVDPGDLVELARTIE